MRTTVNSPANILFITGQEAGTTEYKMLGRRFERSTRCGARVYSINNKIVTFSFHSVSTCYGAGTFRNDGNVVGSAQSRFSTASATAGRCLRPSVVYKCGSGFIMCDGPQQPGGREWKGG